MGEPTIAQFSHMMNLSTPNAAYKINSLVKKGYVERIRSTADKREYHLRPTQKYLDYYNNRRIKAKLMVLPPAIH